jgi:hypothetical protein
MFAQIILMNTLITHCYEGNPPHQPTPLMGWGGLPVAQCQAQPMEWDNPTLGWDNPTLGWGNPTHPIDGVKPTPLMVDAFMVNQGCSFPLKDTMS